MRVVSNPRTTFLFGFYQLIVLPVSRDPAPRDRVGRVPRQPLFHSTERSAECVGGMPALLCSANSQRLADKLVAAKGGSLRTELWSTESRGRPGIVCTRRTPKPSRQHAERRDDEVDSDKKRQDGSGHPIKDGKPGTHRKRHDTRDDAEPGPDEHHRPGM